MKKKTGKTNAAGRKLLQSLREIHDAVVTGDHGRLTVREVEIPDPPSLGSAQVRAIRKATGASVAVFAQLVGVTPAQIEHWEQGRRIPSPLACRLLERIELDPSGYLLSLMRRRSA